MNKFVVLGAGLSLAIGAAGLIGAMSATAVAADPTEAARPDEFVCYVNGVLTERHVGIRDAVFLHRQQDAWKLRYVDQEGSHYFRQAVGETCGVER